MIDNNEQADQQAAILDKALIELAALAPRHVRKFTRQVRSGDKLVTAHIEMVKVEETDAEKIARLEKELAEAKALNLIMEQLRRPVLPLRRPFDYVRINEDDTKHMGLYDPKQSPIA